MKTAAERVEDFLGIFIRHLDFDWPNSETGATCRREAELMVELAVAEERARCRAKAIKIGGHVHDSHTADTVYDHGWRMAAREIADAIKRGD